MGVGQLIADTVDLNHQIEGRSFTVGWLLESLRTNDQIYKSLHGDRAVKEVTSSDVSGGKGFISIICRCIIKFVDSIDDSDVYTTVLKIPGFESLEENAEKCDTEQWFDEAGKKEMTELHQLECSFYTQLAPIFDVPLPKVYNVVEWIYGKQEGCIHMEDLTLRGKTISYFDNINLTQVKEFIRHLAHWHKNILTADPTIWREKFVFKKVDAFKNAIIAFDKMGQAFVEKSSMKHLFDPLVKKYRSFTQNFDFLMWCSKEAIDELQIPRVIVHGDLHSGNIMFGIDKNGDVQNYIAAFVDWQTMHEGSPMEDMARFLTMCADGVVRRQAEQFAIPYYFECLVKEYGGEEKKVPYTIEKLQIAYNYAFATQGLFALGIVPFLLGAMEKLESSKIIKDSYLDYGTLKAYHIYEDLDRLMTDEMKHLFERFGKAEE
jgi:thiamine kinase-like enzyme